MLDQEPYGGFEQGPIRPPSEAGSLLLRVTRNCPWNRCKFCSTYKDTRFSRRPLDQVIRDIEAVYQVGRRTGIFQDLEDLQDPGRRRLAEETIWKNRITPENVDDLMAELMRRFD